VLKPQSEGTDLVMNIPVRCRMGYALRSPLGGFNFPSRVTYWGGNGGSLAFVNLDARMSFGHAQNRCIRGAHEMDRCRSVLRPVYEAFGVFR
jgi:hypothetical protein